VAPSKTNNLLLSRQFEEVKWHLLKVRVKEISAPSISIELILKILIIVGSFNLNFHWETSYLRGMIADLQTLLLPGFAI